MITLAGERSVRVTIIVKVRERVRIRIRLQLPQFDLHYRLCRTDRRVLQARDALWVTSDSG